VHVRVHMCVCVCVCFFLLLSVPFEDCAFSFEGASTGFCQYLGF